MDEDMMNELLKRWAKTEGMSPQDLLDWNAPGRGVSIGSDEFGDMLRDPKPMTTQKPSLRARLAKLLGHKTASSSAATTLPRAAIEDMNYSRRGNPSGMTSRVNPSGMRSLSPEEKMYRDMMKNMSGNARNQMVKRPSWIRRLLGLGARGAKGLSGIGLALDMATNPSELGGQSLQEFLGQSEDGSLTDEEKMQYYQQLANIKSFDDIY